MTILVLLFQFFVVLAVLVDRFVLVGAAFALVGAALALVGAALASCTPGSWSGAGRAALIHCLNIRYGIFRRWFGLSPLGTLIALFASRQGPPRGRSSRGGKAASPRSGEASIAISSQAGLCAGAATVAWL